MLQVTGNRSSNCKRFAGFAQSLRLPPLLDRIPLLLVGNKETEKENKVLYLSGTDYWCYLCVRRYPGSYGKSRSRSSACPHPLPFHPWRIECTGRWNGVPAGKIVAMQEPYVFCNLQPSEQTRCTDRAKIDPDLCPQQFSTAVHIVARSFPSPIPRFPSYSHYPDSFTPLRDCFDHPTSSFVGQGDRQQNSQFVLKVEDNERFYC